MNVPIPVFNLRHGEIEQRLAEKQRRDPGRAHC